MIRLLAAALLVTAAHVVPAHAVEKTYALHVEIAGQDYVADSGLSRSDCIKEMMEIDTLEIEAGKLIRVPAGADVYCVAEEAR